MNKNFIKNKSILAFIALMLVMACSRVDLEDSIPINEAELTANFFDYVPDNVLVQNMIGSLKEEQLKYNMIPTILKNYGMPSWSNLIITDNSPRGNGANDEEAATTYDEVILPIVNEITGEVKAIIVYSQRPSTNSEYTFVFLDKGAFKEKELDYYLSNNYELRAGLLFLQMEGYMNDLESVNMGRAVFSFIESRQDLYGTTVELVCQDWEICVYDPEPGGPELGRGGEVCIEGTDCDWVYTYDFGTGGSMTYYWPVPGGSGGSGGSPDPDDPPGPCAGNPLEHMQITGYNQGVFQNVWGCNRSNGTTCSNGIYTRKHKGIDLVADIGTPVFSIFSGTILNSGSQIYTTRSGVISGWGNWVLVQSNVNGVDTMVVYAHLDEIPANNGTVLAGDMIGVSGETATVGEPHLHIEIRQPTTGQTYNDATDLDPEGFIGTTFDSNGNANTNCN